MIPNKRILESKLNRLKISYSVEGNKIIIGKPKINYINLFGLIVLPLTVAISLIYFIIIDKLPVKGKLIGIIIVFITIAIFTISRNIAKRKVNSNLKILFNNNLKIVNSESEYNFNSKNCKGFTFQVKEIEEQTFNGILLLIDENDNHHKILGFDDENEQYVTDDLKWLKKYFEAFILK